MHWRGDRTGGNDAPSAQPDSGTFDERAAFKKFNGAFPDLLGRSAPIADADMEAFTDFILQVTYPPNPIRPLDNSLTADQEAGRELFDTVNCGIPSAPDGNGAVLTCNSCHMLDPERQPRHRGARVLRHARPLELRLQAPALQGPHLRNLYQKVGMFGIPQNPGFLGGDNGFKGDQVRGFGFLHDGSIDTVFRFVHGISFSEVSPTGPAATASRTGRRGSSSGGSSRRSSWHSPPTWRPSWASRSRSRPRAPRR